MPSVRSYFNGTLFKKNMTRFWPVWAVYFLIWLFMMPVKLFLEDYGNNIQRFACQTVLKYIPNAGLAMAVIFGLLAAAAVWSYLFNSRSVCLMHTLPIRREGLFLTNFLSGMAFMVLPNLAIFLLTLLAEAAKGAVDVGALVMWFFALTLMELFFFCFATICAMCTGHILGLPVLYGVFNFLVAGLVILIEMALSRFVFGFCGFQGAYTLARWLTPVWNLYQNVEVRTQWVNGELDVSTAWLSGFGYILVYMILGLVLAALALALYRRRHMERAGDVITVAWMRPIFQYGVAFCCALAFGTLLFEVFRYELSETAWTLLIFMLLCGAAGYFVAKMLLEKTFRVFGCWKGCLPLLAALVVLTCAMEFDLTGYERRVPDAEQVASVEIYGINSAPYDAASWMSVESESPEVIQAAVQVHRAIAENKRYLEANQSEAYWYEETEGGYSVETRTCADFEVIYTLKNGAEIKRNYSGMPIAAEDLSDADSLTARLNALVNQPEVIEKGYGLTARAEDEVVEMNLSAFLADGEYNGYCDVAVSRDACEAVLQAVMLDFEEGNLGRRYLMDDEERMNNCFANDLEIVFYQKGSGSKAAQEAWSIGVYNGFDAPVTVDAAPDSYTVTVTVTIQTTAKHTIAALKQAGVLEEPVELMTRAQVSALTRALEEAEKYDSEVKIDHTAYVWDTVGG